jgi:hypothetical protein
LIGEERVQKATSFVFAIVGDPIFEIEANSIGSATERFLE